MLQTSAQNLLNWSSVNASRGYQHHLKDLERESFETEESLETGGVCLGLTSVKATFNALLFLLLLLLTHLSCWFSLWVTYIPFETTPLPLCLCLSHQYQVFPSHSIILCLTLLSTFSRCQSSKTYLGFPEVGTFLSYFEGALLANSLENLVLRSKSWVVNAMIWLLHDVSVFHAPMLFRLSLLAKVLSIKECEVIHILFIIQWVSWPANSSLKLEGRDSCLSWRKISQMNASSVYVVGSFWSIWSLMNLAASKNNWTSLSCCEMLSFFTFSIYAWGCFDKMFFLISKNKI